ncbi:uncharacterized protein [Lolium perenne]|uniref:uncharacterized protein n=1 Tax=Lolium perenne TaxID=4522 RepID=UPI003A98F840
MYIKIEGCRLNWVRDHQKEIRADLYKGIVDSITAGETRASAVGIRTVLPWSFKGGYRDMKKRHMDAMALVQTYGKPDIFLTMTCNPNWQEILDDLYPGQTPQDRPDLVARVFRAKLETMKEMLLKNHILGVVKAHDGVCKCRYPRAFNETTVQGKDSYPVYRRRKDGRHAKVRGQILDNRWVVPYNPYLLRMFNCHINVEVCSSIKAVKYLYKYIYKGHDRTSFNIDQPDNDGNIDEIKRYVDARWVTPPEAMWRIFGFKLCDNSPSVLQLPLHLPYMHRVTFKAGENLTDVLARDKAESSMLTEYFVANNNHPWARHILYRDFPGSFTWQTSKYWKPRQERHQVGRVVSAHPAEGDRYFLRVLLNHVPGSTSFDDLKTVDGVLCGSFRQAAEMRGLIDADNTLDDCLTES